MEAVRKKIKRKAFVGKECVACGACVGVCPRTAITIYKGMYAHVDENICIGCTKCVNVCPAGVIDMINREVSV